MPQWRLKITIFFQPFGVQESKKKIQVTPVVHLNHEQKSEKQRVFHTF